MAKDEINVPIALSAFRDKIWMATGGGIENGHIRYSSYGGTQKTKLGL